MVGREWLEHSIYKLSNIDFSGILAWNNQSLIAHNLINVLLVISTLHNHVEVRWWMRKNADVDAVQRVFVLVGMPWVKKITSRLSLTMNSSNTRSVQKNYGSKKEAAQGVVGATWVSDPLGCEMLFPGVKLPAPRPEPPGLETRILRSLFAWLCWGSLFIVEPSLFARLFEWNGNHINVEKTLTSIDIGVVAVLILYWTILFTLGICAGIIKVIKGHAYQADSYPLQDSERPQRW